MLKKVLGCMAVLLACFAMTATMPGCEKSDENKAKDAMKDAGNAAEQAGEDAKDALNN